ncbi:UbiA prenyltransferase family protein [Aliirhizobium smilacinae]|uniref:Decaprenyl-phosphate phosphoribosyltransferase n=1 Tax=Aliirhizobium smilacinae TaxID=1395944 RepID=A0A5C4X8T1_9HYPH|nr:UbiA prenyltransferase family protein [Rhizobium smilacinae]TNM59895.1 hypothetical protein FHP24_27385 [Rhizobium smilacinae]
MPDDICSVTKRDKPPLPSRAAVVNSALRDGANLLRVRQWPKNALVFAPLILSPGAGSIALIDSIVLYFGFCFLASSVYIINDIADAESDRAHPKKKYRPIASGAISPTIALRMMASLLLLAIMLGALLPISAGFMMISYLLLNILYSFYLKKIPIIEIFCVAAGFVVRVFVGTEVVGLAVSHELMAFVFFFCAFISVGKRRQEIILSQAADPNAKHRVVLQHYNLAFLDSLLSATVISSGIFFWLHVIDLIRSSTGSAALFTCLSALSVTALIFRYLQGIYVESTGDNPVDFFIRDPFTLLSGLTAAAFYWLSISPFV